MIEQLVGETKQFREGFFDYINNQFNCPYRLKDDPESWKEWWNGYDEADKLFGDI